ncbi:DUF2975 domain-containing protein [Psychroflexus planctonicus]|uniref:DUF2975 domain-containing protein n=1 Tax=Psychroflexus planctonicus TaxID=1526575 RepID=A0ABQ1SGY9_9FLAO|nr:DUF2975 domain-containing protein [Psychroflexus planctonicus]GGE37934.1 hypothetical protein GCM10010832_17740 [Psychroflexus planctonicus]
MKLALSVAWFAIQFLRLIFSVIIVVLGFLLIFNKQFWVASERYPLDEKLVWVALFVFSILALLSSNKLVRAIKNFKEKNIFNPKNVKAFKLAAGVTSVYLVGKYSLMLYIHSSEQGKLAWHEWWNDSTTQLSEVISFGMLACFFWVIAKLIEEGIAYKNENDLTI